MDAEKALVVNQLETQANLLELINNDLLIVQKGMIPYYCIGEAVKLRQQVRDIQSLGEDAPMPDPDEPVDNNDI